MPWLLNNLHKVCECTTLKLGPKESQGQLLCSQWNNQSDAKQVTGEKCRKPCNRHQVRENRVPGEKSGKKHVTDESAGKHDTDEGAGKHVTSKSRENMSLTKSAEKHITGCKQGRGKTCEGWKMEENKSPATTAKKHVTSFKGSKTPGGKRGKTCDRRKSRSRGCTWMAE